NVESADALVGIIPKIGKRARVPGRPRWLGDAERFEGVDRNHPGRDGRTKILSEERTERLRFPALHIARGPVVDKAEAKHVVTRPRDPDRLAQIVSGADPYRQLELVVELLRRTEARRVFVDRLTLTVRAPNRYPRRPHRGGPAVIRNRHVFIIRAQRV